MLADINTIDVNCTDIDRGKGTVDGVVKQFSRLGKAGEYCGGFYALHKEVTKLLPKPNIAGIFNENTTQRMTPAAIALYAGRNKERANGQVNGNVIYIEAALMFC